MAEGTASRQSGPVGTVAMASGSGCLQLADRRDSNVSLVFVSAPSCELPDDAVLLTGAQHNGSINPSSRGDSCLADGQPYIASGACTAKATAIASDAGERRAPPDDDGGTDGGSLAASWPAPRAAEPWELELQRISSSAAGATAPEADAARADAAVASTREWLRQLTHDSTASGGGVLPSARQGSCADVAHVDAEAGCTGSRTHDTLPSWPGTGEHAASSDSAWNEAGDDAVEVAPLHVLAHSTQHAESLPLQPTELSRSVGCAWPARVNGSAAVGTVGTPQPLLDAERALDTEATQVACVTMTPLPAAGATDATTCIVQGPGPGAETPANRGRWQALLPHNWLG